MPSTVFVDHSTIIRADYLNEVNQAVFVGIGDGSTAPTSASEVKTNLGLNNVDNTTDLNKPISTATQSAIALKADITQTIAMAIALG